MEIKSRVRIRQACESCRRRRRKCNGRLPCAQCVGYNYRCEYVGGHREETRYDQSYEPQRDLEELVNPDPDSPVRPRSMSHRPDSEHTPSKQTPVESPKRFRPTVDTVKGRYSNAHSGILLPRRVGQSMNMEKQIRFHSYGWNLNTRLEPAAFVAPAVCRLLTYQDVSRYSRIFFKVVDPIYHFLDQKAFLQQCALYWTTEREAPEDLEALVSGVVALGSFFSDSACPVESQLVEHAKQILDLGCAYAPGRLSLNQTAAWVLRTMYLRLTTRPHLSWYASCSTMHVAEAMGLHVDLRDVEIVTEPSSQVSAESISSRTDLFDCAVFLNSIISAEYGRSRVILQNSAEPSEHSAPQLRRLTSLLLRLESSLTWEQRLEILSDIQRLPDEPFLFSLLKTDVTIHLFRRHLHPYQEKISGEETERLLAIIKTGLSATSNLLPLHNPWWNILSTPFQSLMVLLALDVDESLAMVEETIVVLTSIHHNFPTHLAGEVLQTAQALVQGLERRKMRQAKLLSKISNPGQVSVETPNYSEPSTGVQQAEAMFETWLTGDMNWNWLPSGNNFAEGADPNIDVFQFQQ